MSVLAVVTGVFLILVGILMLTAIVGGALEGGEGIVGLFVVLFLVCAGVYVIRAQANLFPAYSITCYEDGEIVFQDRETQVYPEIIKYSGGCMIIPLQGE